MNHNLRHRVIGFFLLVGSLFCVCPVIADTDCIRASGDHPTNTDEPNIHWVISCDSILTITGEGRLECDHNVWGPQNANAWSIKKAVISKDITYLGYYTLSSMANMEYIEVEEGNPTHRSGCNAIIRNGTGTGGDTLMFGCKYTVIPPTCTVIRGYGFADSHKVTTMRIPATVTTICPDLGQGHPYYFYYTGNVFYTSNKEDEGLKDLYVEWTTVEDIPEVKNNRLGDMTKVRLHVPCGTTDLYKQVDGWKKFGEYIEGPSIITVSTDDDTMGTISITTH